MEGLQLI